MFKITTTPIEHSNEALKLEEPMAGGLVYFEGRVRNHNDGHSVQSLEYQCYESMAKQVGDNIIKDALSLFEIHNAHCLHRHGHLKIGDVAVWVGVCSSHRKEAFLACQYIIDKVKSLVPIWKKEHYVNGPAKWVACHNCGQHLHA